MASPQEPSSGKERIVFIDVLRGYAILMMLQGHTVGIVLDDELRDSTHPIYATWHYLKGLTAPAFFFSSGLIFTYLLMKQGSPSARLHKGIKRGGWLIFLGFLLQINLIDIAQALSGQKADYNYLSFLGRSHVLQAIGLALIIIVVSYRSSILTRTPFLIWTLVLANLSFLLSPLIMQHVPLEGLLSYFTNFFTRHKTGFPLLPWIGFTLFGCAAGIATVRWRWYENRQLLLAIFATGFVLSRLSYSLLFSIYRPFMEDPTHWISLNIATYYRLGEVCMLTALIVGLTHWIRIPRFFMVAGGETLSIYFIHVIVLYGGLFGIGLKSWDQVAHKMNGWESAGIALLIEIAFILLALNLAKLRHHIPPLRLLR